MTTPHLNKGRKQTPEHIAARKLSREINGTARGYKITKEGSSDRYSAASKKRWESGLYENKTLLQVGRKHSPETIEKMREIRRQMWADGRYEDKKPATRRRVSKMELSLKPYLEALGYRHNTGEKECFIACDDKTRLPDYIDTQNRRVFEFFGLFWHHPDDEAVWMTTYATKGWECTVLWEDELQEWLEEHHNLVTEKEHTFALVTSRARHRYPERGNYQITSKL